MVDDMDSRKNMNFQQYEWASENKFFVIKIGEPGWKCEEVWEKNNMDDHNMLMDKVFFTVKPLWEIFPSRVSKEF